MPVSFIPFVFPGVDNVRCAFQTRWQAAGDGPYAGGNISLATADDRQSVIGNRRELRAALGLRRMAELNQVHGDAMVFEPEAVEPDAVPRCDSDGMATAQAGLGLAIARDIARRNGAEISLANRPEGGLRATLNIPLAPDA